MISRTNTRSVSWFPPRWQRTTIEPPQPLFPSPHIAEAFQQYIHNEIPLRLIDTHSFKFVDRKAVLHVFNSDIVKITEESVQEQMHTVGVDLHPEAGNYVTLRKKVLQEMIRDVVQYAIFSHRWTESEPTYQEVSTGRWNSRTAGSTKLVQLCETAKKLGYKLVWSDTCCIDQSNPAELSEAIHAMFKWYAHAHLCIVHLGGSHSLANFQHDLWFKRGWTLQELLAPRRIKFYNKHWRPLTARANDKGDAALMHALSIVTGIPQEVVVADNSRGVKGRSVWEIMSWASMRKTTRVEDAAYCLLGLFDVDLTITYGMGEKVFPRFIEAIIARYHTWDVFAWAGEASKQHPALPSAPVCYSKFDADMLSREAGATEFVLTPQGLRLSSVPLVPMEIASEAKVADKSGSYVVTLRPRTTTKTQPPCAYGNVLVVCGSHRLQYLRTTNDLHACILNYKRSPSDHRRGALQVGRTYVCFLLHMEVRNAGGESTWLKVVTDNLLRMVFRGMEGPSDLLSGDGLLDLALQAVHIRAPRAATLGA